MKFTPRNIIIVLLMFIGFLTFTGAFFIVNETKQAIVLQFGDPRKVITKPGLQFKIPFIQDAVFLDSRLLNLDPQPEEMILSDQKRIIVDSFARYRIVNPLKFFQTVRNEATFSDRFGRIINASVRGVIAQYSLTSLLSNERIEILQEIQTQIYTVGKENGYKENLRDWFKLIYEVVFGDENGPRMGFFISFFGVKETQKLIKDKIEWFFRKLDH